MAKRVSRRQHNEPLIHKWWVNLVLSLVLLAATYGVGRQALSSANLLEYAFTIVLLVWAINRFVVGIKHAFDR